VDLRLLYVNGSVGLDPSGFVQELRERGYDVLTASDAGLGDSPASVQVSYASKNRRTLVTFRGTAYRRAAASVRNHRGIVAVDPTLAATEWASRLDRELSTWTAESVRGRLVTVV
jgi:hypothetical protein